MKKLRCLSTSSWLVDPGNDKKPSPPPPDEEAVVEPSPPLPPPPSTTRCDTSTPSYRNVTEIEKTMPYFDGTNEKAVDYGLRISRQLRTASDNIRENLEPNLVPGALESATISALASFMTGLREEVEEIVDRQNPKSLEAAIDLAIMAEAKIADRAAFDNDLLKTFQRVRTNKPSSQTPHLCFNCNKEGHLSLNCRAPRPGVICRNCDKEGHIARHCPEHLNENASH
ncbi:hypothetical protein TKK_0005546 [Trichogramma kaykai]